MMNVLKKALLSLLGLGIVCLIFFCYNQLNGGFSIGMLRSTIPYYPEFDVATEGDCEQAVAFLEQKFYYLGKGCQFYVFESQDGQHVLKFLKHKHLRAPYGLLKLPLPACMKESLRATCARREARVKRLFSGCLLGYRELREETGVEYVHLNRGSRVNKKVTLVDKLGFSHSIAIDKYEFILQKRVVDSREYFRQIADEEELVRCKLQQLIDLVIASNHKKIVDADPAFLQNVGFTLDGSRALLFDVGQLIASTEERVLAEEIKSRLHEMRAWASTYAEKLVRCIDELLADISRDPLQNSR